MKNKKPKKICGSHLAHEICKFSNRELPDSRECVANEETLRLCEHSKRANQEHNHERVENA